MEFTVYDICLASDWDWDRDFFGLVEKAARRREMTTYVVWPSNLEETILRLQEGYLHFRFIFDRASSTSAQFLRLYSALRSRDTHVLDSPERMVWASDKATMHCEFLNRGVKVPYTIILEPYSVSKEVRITEQEWKSLGRPFVIKPASTTGGGTGVVKNAENLEEVLVARREFPNDRYLIQKLVHPLESEGKRFWFRVFHVFGALFFTWWDDLTHLYEVLTEEMIACYRLQDMVRIARRISEICGLNFFSTEMVKNRDHQVLAVDYVNEACDLRMQPHFEDGVPSFTVNGIAERIVEIIHRRLISRGG
jgi:hypothetical protein